MHFTTDVCDFGLLKKALTQNRPTQPFMNFGKQLKNKVTNISSDAIKKALLFWKLRSRKVV